MKKHTTHPITWALLFLLGFQGATHAQKNFTTPPNTFEVTPYVFFSGQVISAKGLPMKNVEIRLLGIENDQTVDTIVGDITDENGFYSFNVIPFAPPLQTKIQAHLDDSPTNGVTMADAEKIALHILGLAPFSTYQLLIAADVNQSGTITSFDAHELTDLLEGKISTFVNNTSWRFINTNTITTSYPGNPFINPPVYIDPNWVPDTVPSFKADFWGIKVGDVDSTVVLPMFTGETSEERLFSAPNEQPEVVVHPNTPNPWQETTAFRFDLPRAGTATLRLFDAMGRLVHEYQTAGTKGLNTFNLSENKAFSPGLYIFSLEFEGQFFVQKTIKF